jgi:hypothetical protein
MAPGTWAQLAVPNQSAILGVGPTTGSALTFAHEMPWNPVNRSIEIIGADHNYNSAIGGANRHMRYNEATNAFVLVGDNYLNEEPIVAHGYDHASVNPANGDLYFKRYGSLKGTLSAAVKRDGTWSALPPVSNGYDQVAQGTCWWSGPFTAQGGHGAQGSFMVYNAGTSKGAASDGQINAFDPLSGKWFFSASGVTPYYGVGTYHNIISYSAVKNVAVFGGGNGAPKKLWKMTADGTVSAMPDAPGATAVGVQRGILLAEPVGGNFLLLSAGELWELNPDGGGAWTRQMGRRQPPTGVGTPGPTMISNMIGVTLPDHGVVAFIRQDNRKDGAFWLYKHR